jgi:hypothetical protein
VRDGGLDLLGVHASWLSDPMRLSA